MNLKRAISWYLMSSYLYYCLDTSVISDYEYDKLCRFILDNYEKRTVHPHWRLIDKELLETGSGFVMESEHYPVSIRSAAETWLSLAKPTSFEE